MSNKLLTVAKFKNSHVFSSMILIPKEARLGAAIQYGSAKNFELIFFGYLTKNLVLNFLVF